MFLFRCSGPPYLPRCTRALRSGALEICINPAKRLYISSIKKTEFVRGIAKSATDGQTVRLSPALVQPIVSDDVAAALTDVAVEEPVNGTVELAGPEPIRLDELVRRFLSANRDVPNLPATE
jgi:hypothetical protein